MSKMDSYNTSIEGNSNKSFGQQLRSSARCLKVTEVIKEYKMISTLGSYLKQNFIDRQLKISACKISIFKIGSGKV